MRAKVLAQQQVGDVIRLTVACWFPVPAAAQSAFVDQNKSSAWPGADAALLDSLRNGRLVERIVTVEVPASATVAQVKAAVEERWTVERDTLQQAQRFVGATWDGTTWTAAT